MVETSSSYSGFNSAQSALETAKALKYIANCLGLRESSSEAICLNDQLDKAYGGMAGSLLCESIDIGNGTVTRYNSELDGGYGLAIRQCGRAGCSFACKLDISAEGIISDIRPGPLDIPGSTVCIQEVSADASVAALEH